MESGKLAPPGLQVNTRQRALSEADTLASTSSNPFLTPTSPSAASTSDVSTFVGDADANQLRRELRDEVDANGERNPFAFVPKQLNRLLNPKSLPAFQALGGVHGIAAGLQSDRTPTHFFR
jgi:Ca2+-transporting ATPase